MKFLIALLFPVLAFATPSSQRELTGNHIKNGAGILQLPTSSDTLTGRATADTLTNKSIAAGTNTITGLTNAAISASAAIDFSKLVTITGDISVAANGTSAYVGVVPIVKGGTNNGSLTVTAGGVLYTDGTKVVNVGVGTTSQVLISNAGSPPSWTAATNLIATVSRTLFVATGTTTGYFFTHGSSSYSIGDTYTDTTPTTYTALTNCAACASGYFSVSAPAVYAGTVLTRVIGVGTASITTTGATPMATYTTPVGKRTLKVTVTAGGGAGGGVATTGAATAGGGAGGGSGATAISWISSPAASYYYFVGPGGAVGAAGNTAGGNGSASNFNLGAISANGGNGGGGSAALSTAGFGQSNGGLGFGAIGDIPITGNTGDIGFAISTTQAKGGAGGNSYWSAGGLAVANACISGNSGAVGGGGGAGGVCTNSSAKAGGPGGNGLILIEEF